MKIKSLIGIILISGLFVCSNSIFACLSPTASFEVSPATIVVGGSFTLDASNSNPSAGYSINLYEWNYDYGANPNSWVVGSKIMTNPYSYLTPGTYTIGLTVRNSANKYSNVCLRTITVKNILYVNKNAPAGGDGFSWATAFNDLQDALNIATSGVQIWVAQGTYVPSKLTVTGDPRSATFQLANGVSLYGGFNGTETSLNQRDWQAYSTVLSGDLAGDDVGNLYHFSRWENAYHVVTGSDTNATAVLDGFAITAGYADNCCDQGGGMYNLSGSPTVNNCGFSYNGAYGGGGGVYNNGGEPNFTNCTFSLNGEGNGAGVYNSGGIGIFTGCIFSGNNDGAAMYNANGAAPLIKNCIFTNNNRGAIYNGYYNDAPYSPQIINCIFAGNSALNRGGAIYLSMNCHAAITNCVFNNNSTDDDGDGDGGGAIYNDGGEPNFYNCIFWGDSANDGGEIYNKSGTIKISYCDINEGNISNHDTITDGGCNINADPRFADVCNPAGLDGIFFTDDDGLQLEPNSPCIDACPASGSPDKDILGRARVNIPFVGSDSNDYSVDMGAYEVQRPAWHVKQESTGSNNGIGWNNAFNYLQDALAAASTYGGDIWVAAGTYKPDQGGGKTQGAQDANFALINGVGIYGGFAGNETMCSRRDPIRNETILSGNIDETGNSDSYNVVTASNVSNTAVLAGFTISDGNASGASPYNCGGGMYDNNASPTIMDCNFKNNKAQFGGGDIYNKSNSSPVIIRCLFVNEVNISSASYYGGAIYNNSSSPKISNCNFINNITTRFGGAIGNLVQSSPTLLNCAFSGNKAGVLYTGYGGAVYNSNSLPSITNCIFAANLANNGGGIYNASSSPTLVNCTFNKNSATGTSTYGYGGGIYNASSCNPAITNCIFWGDNAVSDGNEIYNFSATPTFSHCDIEGCMAGGSWNTGLGTDGGGNIDVDPNFVDPNNPAGPDGIFGTSDDGLQLQIFDPNLPSCIDAADGNAAPATDFRGHGRIDIAYVPNTGSGDPNYADIGAYEYDDTPGYITSFETDQGYGGQDTINGVDGWKVEVEGDQSNHCSIVNSTYTDTNGAYPYQYFDMLSNSKISHETNQPSDESTVHINCIPSSGSYINILSGPAMIASIKFGEDGKIYVWDNGVYEVSSVSDYNTIANTCHNYLNNKNGPSYEGTWIEFTIEFNWVNHSYDVYWTNYAFPNGAVIYSGAMFYSDCSSYTKVEFIAGTNNFELNRMSLTDTDAAIEGGVIAPDGDIWLIAPQSDLTDPLKGRCAIVGKMWYSELGQYIIKCCPSDLDTNDANSWMQVCSGRTISKDPTTLGYWNTAAFYNGDYFLKIEVYDDIGQLHTSRIITVERMFNGRTPQKCNATYPIIGRFKPQTFTYQDLPDFKINWPGSFPFEFQRMYDSGQASRLYPLFFGWTHNHNIRLIEDTTFDWIKDANGKPVRDGKGLGVGKLWLCLPSGGGLYIGKVDDTNTNNVIYKPTDNTNQHIIRTVNYINNPTTTSDVCVTYVYYAPDGRKMTFTKGFTVNFPVPSDINEGLIDWMVVKGVDRQEDRFGNALLYTWDSYETCLQEISNNRTPAKLVLTYGMLVYNGFFADPFLCKEIRLYNGDEPTEAYISLSGDILDVDGYLGYSADRSGDTLDYYLGGAGINSFRYEVVGNTRNLIIVGTYAPTCYAQPRTRVDIEYHDDGTPAKVKQSNFQPTEYQGYYYFPYTPTEYYTYEYDNTGNLITTIDVNAMDDSSLTTLRKDIIITSPDGKLLSKCTRTYPVLSYGEEFDPYDYHYWTYFYNTITNFGFHAGSGGATDVNYYYEDSRFPFNPTTVITYFSDDGSGVYNKPSQKTTLAYDNRGDVNEQKVYVDDVNYVLTTFAYHNNYDFQTRKTTWQVYRHDGDSDTANLWAKVEQQWLYGDVNGNLVEDGNGGDYLAVQRTLLDNTISPEQWADVCCTYYSGGQIEQKTDPEGGISYYQYDSYGFECNEWQGATFAGGAPVGNPQKRYYYDGLGHKVLEADYLGKVQMDIWDTYGQLKQDRQYIDTNAVSRSDFEPSSYDTDILSDGIINSDRSVDWWSNRTLYCYFGFSYNPGTIILPTGGEVYYFLLPRRPYREKEAVFEYHVADDHIEYLPSPDDGRTLYEDRMVHDNYYSDRIDNVYDSMRRLIHKYSFFDDLAQYQQGLTPGTQHRYIKHEVYQYDASGNKTSETVYKVEMNGDGSYARTLEKSNSYEYDILNRLTEEIVDSNTGGLNLTTQYGYDAVGNRIYVIAPDGNVILTDYDNANRKVCEYFATTPVYITGTDKINVAAMKNSANTKARKDVSYYKNDKVKDANSYDYNGGLLARSQYSYDSRGRIKDVNEQIDATQIATTSYDYNDAGFDLPGGDPCGYKYQIKITDANNKSTWISMHPLGKPQKIVYPSNDYEEYIYYNLALADTNSKWNGLLEYKAVWDASGNKKYITYEYDAFGKVSKITYPDGGYLTYDYTMRTLGDYGLPKQIIDYRTDADRPRSDVNSYGGIYTFDYWYPTGKLKSYTDYSGYTVNYDYSATYGSPTHIDVNAPNGGGVIYEVNYAYDMAGRLNNVCEPLLGDNQNLIAGFDYDKNGNRQKLYYYRDGTGNPSTTISVGYTYNRDNMLTGFSTSGGPVFALGNVSVDGLGRLTSASEIITNTSQTQIQHSYTNQYDMRSELNYALRDSYLDTYSYDKAGNVTSHTSASAITSYGFKGDLMTSAFSSNGGDNFASTWNNNGDLNSVSAPAKALVYNWDNKLRSATNGPNSISLKYDPMGNRVYKNSSAQGTRKYVVDIAGGLPTILLEVNSVSGSIMKSYIYANSEVLAQHDGDSTAARYFYLHDRLGSVRELIGTDGLVKSHYTYGPFGQTVEQTGSGTLSSPFMFASQYYDYEISQYYMRARQYDPQLMRFTGRDSADGDYEEPMSLHRYLYCLNDPIDSIDPTGKLAGEMALEADEAVYAVGILGIAYVVVEAANIQGAALELMTHVEQYGDKVLDLGIGVMACAANYAEDALKGGKIKDRDKWPNEVQNKPDFGKFRKWFDKIWKPKSHIKEPTPEDIGEAYDEFTKLWQNWKK